MRYGSKPLEFAKDKNAIELGTEAEVADVLAKVREACEHGELDALIEQQAQFGRRVARKNKSTERTERTEERAWIKHVLRLTMCNKGLRKLLNCNSYTSVGKTCRVNGELHTSCTQTIGRR